MTEGLPCKFSFFREEPSELTTEKSGRSSVKMGAVPWTSASETMTSPVSSMITGFGEESVFGLQASDSDSKIIHVGYSGD